MISAEQLIERIQKNLGILWQSQPSDGFSDGVLFGSGNTMVKGIVTTFTRLEVLRKVVNSGMTVVLPQGSPVTTAANALLYSGEMLQPLRKHAEAPIQFIPSGDPFWMPA